MAGPKKKLQEIEKKYGIIIYTILAVVLLNVYSTTSITVYVLAIGGVFLLYYFKHQSYLPYIFGGAIAALVLKFILGLLLSTSLPGVSVLSGSMVHDESTEVNHYHWLEENMGYNRSYIDSWPIKDGFLPGDIPIIQGASDYKVGDVVVYDTPSEPLPVIHRIIKINPDGTYMTKGDHNPYPMAGTGKDLFEYSVRPEQVHGRVIFIIPKLGYFKVIFHYLFGGT